MKYCVERIYAAQTNTLGNRNSKRKGGTKNYTGNTANDDVELGHVTSLRPDIYIYIYIYTRPDTLPGIQRALNGESRPNRESEKG